MTANATRTRARKPAIAAGADREGLPRLRQGRILVVDDDPPVIELLRDYFVDAGYRVEGALNGGDALMLIQQHRPDMVLLDLYMPGMAGVEVLGRIRTLDPTIPVIIATASRDLALAQRTLKMGAVDYITKPFDFAYLARAVAAASVTWSGAESSEPAEGLRDPREAHRQLVRAVLRATDALAASARLSIREPLERTVLEATREAGAARGESAAELLRQLEILVQAAVDLGDLPLAHRTDVDNALLEAHRSLSRPPK